MIEIDKKKVKEIIPEVLGRHYRSDRTEGRTVKLFDLIEEVYSEYGLERHEIHNLMFDGDYQKFIQDFVMDINGCYSEARVGSLTVNNNGAPEAITRYNIPENWGDMKLDCGSYENPLIFITGDKPVEVPNYEVKANGEGVFLVYSDIHLEEYLIGVDGEIKPGYEGKLDERIDMFFQSQADVIEHLRKNGVKVNGILFTGDTLDVNEKYVVDKETSKKYSNLVLERIRKRKEEMGFETPDVDYVVGILGNHEARLGSSFEECSELMEGIVQELFGSNATILGSGAARIKIGESFMSIQHPNSTDFNTKGVPVSQFKKPRTIEFAAVTLYEEYVKLCQYAYDELRREGETVTLTRPTPNGQINLADYVYIRLHDENPELFKFYEPFITCDRDLTYAPEQATFNPAEVSFFESHISIDAHNGIVIGKNPKFQYPGTAKREDIRATLTDFHKVLQYNKEMYNSVLGYNPFYVRDDLMTPTAILMGHNHEKTDEVSITEEDGKVVDLSSRRAFRVDALSDSKKMTVITEEPKSREYDFRTGETTMRFTVVNFKLNENKIYELCFDSFAVKYHNGTKVKKVEETISSETTFSTKK